jgi:hypothetical protein
MLIAGIQDASAEALDPDLVLYFDYEDFKGGTVAEKSGRGYDGEINGKITQSDDGKFGKAATTVRLMERSHNRMTGSSGKPPTS